MWLVYKQLIVSLPLPLLETSRPEINATVLVMIRVLYIYVKILIFLILDGKFPCLRSSLWGILIYVAGSFVSVSKSLCGKHVFIFFTSWCTNTHGIIKFALPVLLPNPDGNHYVHPPLTTNYTKYKFMDNNTIPPQITGFAKNQSNLKYNNNKTLKNK